MTKHENLVKTINEYLSHHNFSKAEFCRLASIETSTFDKIINKEHYISLTDYQKLAHVLNLDITQLLTY